MANWFLHKRAIRVPGFRPLMDADIRCWLIIQPLALVGSPVGDLPCEPHRRKPRAIAISPAPNRLCYTAGITNLLGPKRSVVGAYLNRPTACAGWLTG
jgi:hypothetical protein